MLAHSSTVEDAWQKIRTEKLPRLGHERRGSFGLQGSWMLGRQSWRAVNNEGVRWWRLTEEDARRWLSSLAPIQWEGAEINGAVA